jgi:Luciferase-like monooxygenase
LERPLAKRERHGKHIDGRKQTRISLDCPHEEDRLSLVRTLDALAAITDPLSGRHSCNPSTWPLPPELGADGAYFRVHHFARQLASPFPLLAAVGAKTSRIEIGTAVIDMRYENPFYMAEDAGAADLIAGRRLQLGISRGSPEQVIDGGS